MKSIYAIENRELPEQEAAPEATASAEEEPDRVWTVNEIMEEGSAEPLSPDKVGITAELDDIINDVLKDS